MSRPRPRLVSRQAKSSEQITPATSTVQDEDDHFRRNRGRTAQHWKQLGQCAAKAAPSAEPLNESEEFSDGGSSPRLRKKKKQKQVDRPRWQRPDTTKLLSSDIEDDDVQILEHIPGNCQTPSPNKRKRERSRSRSLTPPPALPAHQKANAMMLVRQALAVQPTKLRAPSPTFFPDDSTDTIELDPELARIAESVRKQMQNARLEPEPDGGPEAVVIKVLWRPHPLNTSAEETSWTFKIRRNDPFRVLFDELADLAGVMVEQLVVTYDHRRVFASGTPSSLRIWASGELEACDKSTDEYIRNNRNKRAPSPPLLDIASEQSPSAAQQSDADSEAEGGDTIKLNFRSAATKDKTVPLTVRKTTTCGTIVKAFLKAANLPDNYSAPGKTGKKGKPFPQLMIDGDKMDFDAEIGDADLEDGDLVEIVGV